MAIELSFCVTGKETKQALFVEETELDIPLTKVRKFIEKQELHVPVEYKFLTKSGNAIAHPSEENIFFRDVIQTVQTDLTQKDVKFEDVEVQKGEGSVDKPIPNNSQLWITPLKVIDHSDENGQNQQNNSRSQQNSGGAFCPYTNLKRVFCRQDGSIDVPKIVKTVVPLAAFLFVSLGILTFTLHVFVKALMLKTGPSMLDILARFEEGGLGGGLGGSSSMDVTNLKIKLSQLEMSHKFDVEQLTNRVSELEDLYLKDLDYHKRELNSIKRRLVEEGVGRTILEDEDVGDEDEDQHPQRLVKEGKKKYTAPEGGRTHG